MEIGLKKDKLDLSQLHMNDTTQILVEGDVIVPDVKPDIAAILQTDADAVVVKKERSQGKLMLTGTIFLKILYVPEGTEGDAVKSINTKFDFTDELPMADEDAFVSVSALCDQVEYGLVNSRKMNFKILVSLTCKSYTQRTVEFVTGVEEEQQLERRSSKVKLYNVKLLQEAEFVVAENLDVPNGKPDIGDILKMDVKISKGESKLMNGRAMLKGNLNLCTLYLSDMEGLGIEFMEHELPFSEVVDLEGLEEGDICDVRYAVKDVYYDVKDDLNGDPRLLSAEVLLACEICVSETKDIALVEDCYAPVGETKLTTQNVQLEELVCDDTSQMTLKELIAIPENLPSVDGVYNVIAQPVITGQEITGEGLVLQGMVYVNILYVSSNTQSPLHAYRQELPFRHVLRAEGLADGMTCDVTASAEHTSFSLNMASEVEVRCVLEFNTKVIRSYLMDVITGCEVEEVEEDRSICSLVIYFIQPGDCLWDIAKHYKTTIDKIKSANRLEEGCELITGQKLLIPRR